jgi:MRC1-like domain
MVRNDQLEHDEKAVQILMHDLQNGGLRRRRGRGLEMGDWDSDGDDSDDDAEERRRRWELKREDMKRRMLEDENLGKLGMIRLKK